MKDALAIRQCTENIRAVLRLYDLPIPVLIATLSDRVLFDRSRIFLDQLMDMVPADFETWDFVRNHGVTALRGWRERVARCSLQVVEHSGAVIECDIDLYNPSFGVLPALGHLCEIIGRGKTNPWTVAKGLRKRGITVSDATKEIT